MPNEIDKSLLDRLQALRGSSTSPERVIPPTKISIDTIERARTPTREDALAARLKSLRSEDGASPSSPSPKPSPSIARTTSWGAPAEKGTPSRKAETQEAPKAQDTSADDEEDSMLQTDDQTLEELLADVGADEQFGSTEPKDEDVRALLEELSQAVPKGEASRGEEVKRDSPGSDHSDDSDGEEMQREVADVVDKFRDAAEIHQQSPTSPASTSSGHQEAGDQDTELALPSVPTDLQDLPTPPSAPTDLDDMTARLAALRAGSASPSASGGSLSFPDAPTSRPKPGDKPVKRLTSRTKYTDDDVDSWCTVCLEDATLTCLGCDGDPYCARCWREMHVGPAAAYDDRSHRAVVFGKDKKGKEKKNKVAVGA